MQSHGTKDEQASEGAPSPPWLRWLASGGFAAIFSAVGYTAANICLRASTGVPPSYVAAMKAVWTVIIFLPWVAWLVSQKTKMLPSRPQMLRLIAVSVFAQLAGNWCFQWSLGIIGLATVVPLTIGAMLIGGAILGRLFLNEGVTQSTAIAIVVMLLAIGTLWWGVVHERQSVTSPAVSTLVETAGEGQGRSEQVTSQADAANAHAALFWVILATAGACSTGLVYAVLGITIRQTMREGVPLATPMMAVGLSGTLVLGGIAWREVGLSAMWQIDATNLLFMCLAGIANAVAFLALTRSLKLIPVVYVNAINASQVAMAAVAGIMIFDEQLTRSITAGVCLTILGFAILYLSGIWGRRKRQRVLETAVEASPLEASAAPPATAKSKAILVEFPVREPCGSGKLDA